MWYRIRSRAYAYKVARTLFLAGYNVARFGVSVVFDAEKGPQIEGKYVEVERELPPRLVEKYRLSPVPGFEPECSRDRRRSFSGVKVSTWKYRAVAKR